MDLGPTHWAVEVFWDPPRTPDPGSFEADDRLEDCSLQSDADSGVRQELDPTTHAATIKPIAYEPKSRRKLLVAQGLCAGQPATIDTRGISP